MEASASNLNTNDAFVLKSPGGLFVWKGVGASDEEMAAAKHVVAFLGGSPNSVTEGREPGQSLSFCAERKLHTSLYLIFERQLRCMFCGRRGSGASAVVL